MRLFKTLPLPEFYHPEHAADINYGPDQQHLFEHAQVWRRRHAIASAAADKKRIHLLAVDLQKDFCFRDGSLFVAGRGGNGAVEDNQRIAAFIYKNLGAIGHITVTLDTHLAFHIFFASFWMDRQGRRLKPHTSITVDMIRAGEVQPDPAIAAWLCGNNHAWLREQVAFYCQALEKAGKYSLYLWPPHAIIGSSGHGLAGVIHEARLFHSYVRVVQSWTEIKGMQPLTESYSVLGPEVHKDKDGNPLDRKNTQLLETLIRADALVIVGQAASHCVKSTIDDLLDEMRSRRPELAQKVYILSDCMSAVTVPDADGGFAVDFTSRAEQALAAYRDAGMRIVRSSDPMASWPGMDRLLAG